MMTSAERERKDRSKGRALRAMLTHAFRFCLDRGGASPSIFVWFPTISVSASSEGVLQMGLRRHIARQAR